MRFYFKFGFWILLALFFSCTGRTGKNRSVNNFRTTLSVDPVTLDPQLIYDGVSDRVARQIYETLVTFSPDSLELIPLLAKDWEVKDNGRRYVFTLRKGVKFHDDPCFPKGAGREMVAEDVKYSWDRIMRARPGQPIGWQFIQQIEGYYPVKGFVKEPTGIRVLGRYELEVKLKDPVAFFPGTTYLIYAGIVPREAVEYYGEDFEYHPVGTGPFKFQSWERNRRIVLMKNEKYWQKDESGVCLPYLDYVTYYIQSNPLVQWLEFEAGRLEAAVIPADVLHSLFPEGRARQSEKVTRSFEVRWQPLSLNSRFIEFEFPPDTQLESHRLIRSSKKLRQAMNYAIDREGLIRMFFPGGQALPAKSKLPPLHKQCSALYRGYYYDPNKARRLLEEAGFPEGKNLPEFVLRVPTPDRNMGIARKIQSDFGKVGIRLKLLPYPEYMEPSRKDILMSNMRLAGWTADYPDLFTFIAGISHNKVFPDSLSRRFTNLEKIAATEINDSVRTALYYEIDRESAEWAYEIFLYHQRQQAQAVKPYVEGYRASPFNDTFLKTVRITNRSGQ
ncbi:MAG: ABC transporter substrate-binding protein [FCB group bacterium]|nr:ABC transporter substrate-binding protein [FCB group bacterium]